MARAELFNSSEHLPDVFTQPLYSLPVKQALHVISPSYKGSSPRVSHGHTQSLGDTARIHGHGYETGTWHRNHTWLRRQYWGHHLSTTWKDSMRTWILSPRTWQTCQHRSDGHGHPTWLGWTWGGGQQADPQQLSRGQTVSSLRAGPSLSFHRSMPSAWYSAWHMGGSREVFIEGR